MHTPVLKKEALYYLDPNPNENFIDCTIGWGGHTFAILEKNAPKGKVLGIDSGQELINNLKNKAKALKLGRRLILICDNFANLEEIIKNYKFRKVSGILLDLGMSSWHLEESKKGFSFLRDENLDMRYSSFNPQGAEKILNFWSLSEIEKILREYGEESFSKQIAQEIISSRKDESIKTTNQLVEIIKKAVPRGYQRKKIHFATKTFQALRIAVNDELNNLEKVLPQALEVLNKNGRLVVISFHSLEDRIVKNFLKKCAKPSFVPQSVTSEGKEGLPAQYFSPGRIVSGPIVKILTKKPIAPSLEEIKSNPRSRSAKLRVAIKL